MHLQHQINYEPVTAAAIVAATTTAVGGAISSIGCFGGGRLAKIGKAKPPGRGLNTGELRDVLLRQGTHRHLRLPDALPALGTPPPAFHNICPRVGAGRRRRRKLVREHAVRHGGRPGRHVKTSQKHTTQVSPLRG